MGHKLIRSNLIVVLIIVMLFGYYGIGESKGNTSVPVLISFNPAETYQEITGFGAFGLREFNFGNLSEMYDDIWAEQVFNDLGLTITRNEWYPDKLHGEIQDSNWVQQKPYLQAFHTKAKSMGIQLKQVIAVWSPPGNWKTNQSTKNGGHLKPEHYGDFADWLISCLQAYQDAGIEVYGISPQNEPDWKPGWNSCAYSPSEYVAMIKAIGPVLRKHFPQVKIMGPDTCLIDQRYRHFDKSIEKALLEDQEARQYIDIWVTHGYSIPLGIMHGYFNLNKTKTYWEALWNRVKVTGNPLWLTELDYYPDDWDNSLNVAEQIYVALKYGNVSGWLWWQLGGVLNVPGVNPLMKNGSPTNKYYAVKHFYRYIRPGAVRIQCDVGNEGILAVAFKHPTTNTITFVLINSTNQEKTAVFDGGLTGPLEAVRSSSGEKCLAIGKIFPGSKMNLPPKSIITLYGIYK